MSESNKYNKLSSKLRSFLPELKPGEKIKFQINGVRPDKITGKLICPNSFNLKATDRIYDPWAGKKLAGKDQYEGAYVDIGHILRESPAPVGSNRESIIEFGSVRFTKATAGVLDVIGGQRDRENMLILLFFSNRNSTNIGKPWFIKPQGKMVFHQIETVKKATDKLKTELRQDKAREIISAMSEEEVKTASAGLFPNMYHGLTEDERRLKLRTIAAKNPEKILNISEDVDVSSVAFIEECLKAGLIDMDKGKGEFVWADDKQKICTLKPGQTPHNSLKRYFATDEGGEVLLALEKQLEMTKKSKKEKTDPVVV